MKAISLHQPYASAVAIGLKRYETRSHLTRIRGRIAIHAAKHKSRDYRCLWYDFMEINEIRFAFEDTLDLDYDLLPFGAIIATAELVHCQPIPSIAELRRLGLSDTELTLGHYGPGRFMWRLGNVRLLHEPLPFKARQSWFDVPSDLLIHHVFAE